MLAAESLFTPAGDGLMPKRLAAKNAQGVPAAAMWLTSAMVQVFLLVTLFSKASYLALISLSTAMILLPYLASAVFGVMVARQPAARDAASVIGDRQPHTAGRQGVSFSVAVLATLYCAWLLYAAGPKYLLLSALLYAPGALLFLLARREQRVSVQRFEWLLGAALLVMAAVAGLLLSRGTLSL